MEQVYAIALEEMIRLKRQLPGKMRHAMRPNNPQSRSTISRTHSLNDTPMSETVLIGMPNTKSPIIPRSCASAHTAWNIASAVETAAPRADITHTYVHKPPISHPRGVHSSVVVQQYLY